MTVTLLEGHVVDVLAALEPGTFHCAVCSPPYWQLRAYGTAPQTWPDGWVGELGQEDTPEVFITHLVEVFRAVKRVLRQDASLWVNLSGSYFSEPGGQNGGASNTLDYGAGRVSPKVMEANRQNGRRKRGRHAWLKPLDWVDVPGLFARAMQQDGWTWRSDVVWVKPSALPESVSGTRWERCRVLAQGQEKRGAQVGAINVSVDGEASKSIDRLEPAKWADCPGCPRCAQTDGLVLRRGSGRPTKATERILLFTRGPGYYFDQEAVREKTGNELSWEEYAERTGPGKGGWGGEPVDGFLTKHNGSAKQDGGRSHPNGRNLRDWWVIGGHSGLVKLRSDLTPEQRAYVAQRIVDAGSPSSCSSDASSGGPSDAPR